MRSDLKNRSANSTRFSPAITKRLKSVEDLANPSSSSSIGSCFKENVNINKSDPTKLSAEPLPMKRKKKGGGYNLRKSLAWDRAFFTEEGVLDPIELSTISGTSCGEGLFVIDEEIYSDSCYPMESADTLAIENDLIKEPPNEALDKYRSDCLSSKPNSSAPNDVISTSMTSQKSSRPSSKCGSNCGDSTRSLPTSSLKRPANITIAKSATNSLKLLKVPVPKSGPRVKHNQVTEPVVSVQRNIGSKRNSKSKKNAEDTSKAGTLRPSRHSKGNSENSLQIGQLSIDKSPLLVDKPNNSGSKMITGIMVPFNPGHSFESRDPTAISISVAQNACSSGANMHLSPNQAPRPSGLRMPSPSLSFFSQPKTSGSCSLSWRNTDSNVCGIQKLEDLRSLNTLRKSPKLANGTEASTSNRNRLISSRSECSAPFEVNAISLGIIESNMEENSTQKVGTKVLFDANSSEPKGNNIDINEQIQDVLKQIEIEKIIPQEDMEFQNNDKEVPLQSASFEKVRDDIKLKSTSLGSPGNRESCMSGWGSSNLVSPHDCLMLGTSRSDTKAATDEQHKETKICKFSVSKHDIRSQTRPGEVNDHRWQNSLMAGSNLVETCMKDCHDQPTEQIDQLKFSLGKTYQGPTGDGHILKTNRRGNEPAKTFQEYGSCYVGNLDCEALESNLKSSASKNEHKDLPVEAATTDARTYNLHMGQAQLQSPEDILSIESSKNNINHILVVGGSNKQSGKASELQDIHQEVELDSQNNYMHTNDWLLPEKQACCIESLQEKLTETLPVVAMAGKDANQIFDVYMDSTQAPAAVHDNDLHIDTMTKQPLIRDKQFNSIENIQSSESRNILIDLTSSYDGVLAAEANYLKLRSSPNEVTKSFVGGDGRLPDDNEMWNMGINELKADLFSDSASKQLSNSPHQETQAIEINYSSLFSRSLVFEESQQIIIEKTIDSTPMLDGYHENNLRTSALIGKERGFGVDKESTVSCTEDLMVQSYDKALHECCVKLTSTEPSQYVRDVDCDGQSGHLKLPNPVVGEDLFRSNGGLSLKNCSPSVKSIISDEYDQTSVLNSMVDSVTKPSDLHGGEIKSSVDVQKPTLMHKTCRDADEIVSQSCIQDQNKIEGSQDSSTSVSEESDEDKAAFASINKFGDGLKKKSHKFIAPQNAVPFSDEWLSAIEAAGEDILTMKSGAVQHSPPDKFLPEPNPWSPVKRKTNQIGPFDCTKFTTISPSNSS